MEAPFRRRTRTTMMTTTTTSDGCSDVRAECVPFTVIIRCLLRYDVGSGSATSFHPVFLYLSLIYSCMVSLNANLYS